MVNGMSTTFPFLDVPTALLPIIGVPDGETRIRRATGDAEYFRRWCDALMQELAGQLVPREFVADYVGVSRAAVHKRAKAGQLTCFIFNVVEPVRVWLGVPRTSVREQYILVSLQECRAWRDEVKKRANRQKE